MQVATPRRIIALAVAAAVVAACSGGGGSSPAASEPAASTPASAGASAAPPSETGLAGSFADGTWDAVLAAAKEEGTLNLWVHSGAGYEEFGAIAKEALAPLGIDVQVTSAGAGSQAPLIAQEQQGGVFTWDVNMAGNSGVAATLNPIGATIPIRPFYEALNPELLQDDLWVGGFHVYANDDELNWVTQYQLNGGLWINRDLAPDVDDADDLLDPQWKGKIVIHDPTTVSTGSGSIAAMLASKGEDYVRTLLQDQEPFYTEGPEGMHEAVADGRAAIGIGGNSSEHQALQADGIGLNVEEVQELDLFMYVNIYAMSVFKNLPHPNATAVFMDWALSEEGMQAWAEKSRVDGSSRRIGTTGGGRVITADELSQFKFIGGTYAGQDLQSTVFELATQ